MATLTDMAVLLPAYNCCAELHRTLASFAEEDCVRVLIVDDGSTPPITVPALPGIDARVLRLASNGGIARALAAGVDALAASGVRYIARIDAGDIALPGRLTKQRAYFDAYPKTVMVGMWSEAVTRAGQHLFVLKPPTDPTTIRRQRFFRSCFVHPAIMLRTDAVLAAGNYRCRYRAAEDLDLFLQLMEEGVCVNLPEVGVRFELNDKGISAQQRRAQIISTLRLQWRYFEPLNSYYWLGFAKNLLHLITPYPLLQRVKQYLIPLIG